jgi:hypothetical protein
VKTGCDVGGERVERRRRGILDGPPWPLRASRMFCVMSSPLFLLLFFFAYLGDDGDDGMEALGVV